jgi:hypothetical protein
MKKILGTALIAAMLTGTVATAQSITPLDTTASTQADSLPILATIPPGAVVVLGFVILGGVIIGISSDGTS